MESQYGYRTDPVTGLELVGARYYDPQSGRFLTRDPAGYFGGMNLYEYAGDSPTGSIDPSGLFSFQDAWNFYLNNPWSAKVDNFGFGGAAANFGNTFGEYDSGCASALDVAVAGASLAGQMATFVIPGGEEAKGVEAGVRVASSLGGDTARAVVERVLQRGEKLSDLINELKVRTWETGNEHALVTLESGERAIVSGGAGGIDFAAGEIQTLFAHTHPLPAPASSADFDALGQLGQKSSWVISGGEITKIVAP